MPDLSVGLVNNIHVQLDLSKMSMKDDDVGALLVITVGTGYLKSIHI